jgi:membrane protease YdiL (CAAX protease family)
VENADTWKKRNKNNFKEQNPIRNMLYYLILAFLVVFPLFWLRIVKSLSWEKIKEELLPKPKGLKKEAYGSIKLLVLLLIGFFLFSLLFSLLGLNDLEKVNQVIKEEIEKGIIQLIATLIVVLFIEELFFRVFLVKRIGIIPSTIIFAAAHYGYGSTAEILGAFFLGLILAYWYKKNNSLIQNYFGHLFYDIVAIIIYLLI